MSLDQTIANELRKISAQHRVKGTPGKDIIDTVNYAAYCMTGFLTEQQRREVLAIAIIWGGVER